MVNMGCLGGLGFPRIQHDGTAQLHILVQHVHEPVKFSLIRHMLPKLLCELLIPMLQFLFQYWHASSALCTASATVFRVAGVSALFDLHHLRQPVLAEP